MKLQNIATDSKRPYPYGESARFLPQLPTSYVFIESVIDSGLLSEASSSRLGAVLSAGLAKLQNFLTPDASTDFDSLLAFIAPKGGGLPKIKDLIVRAKEIDGALVDNEDWWREVFEVCGVKDPAIQERIRSQVAKEVAPKPEKEPEPPAPPEAEDNFETSFRNMWKPPTGSYGSDPRSATHPVEKAYRHRQMRNDRIKLLHRSLQRLHGQDIGESICNAIAQGLLNEGSVRSNLKFVASNTVRRLGCPSVANFEDENWLNRFMRSIAPKDEPLEEGFRDFARGARNFLANPKYTIDKLDDTSRREQNQQSAKLALQLIFDHLKKEMGVRLRVAGLTLDDLHETVKMWNKLHAKYRSGSRDPRLMAKLAEVFEKLKSIIFALQPEMAKGEIGESLKRFTEGAVCG